MLSVSTGSIYGILDFDFVRALKKIFILLVKRSPLTVYTTGKAHFRFV